MSRDFVAHVRVGLKPGVVDPQGSAVLGALKALGFDGVGDVRVGKWITVRLTADDEDAARRAVEAMCGRLLANPVLEDYDFHVTAAGTPGAPGHPLSRAAAVPAPAVGAGERP